VAAKQEIPRANLEKQREHVSRTVRNGSFAMLGAVALRLLVRRYVPVEPIQSVVPWLVLAAIVGSAVWIVVSIRRNARALGLSCTSCGRGVDLNRVKDEEREYKCTKCGAAIRFAAGG
jgi:predicted RNA-binding Zn-ribbon protein involved in translation (DUF1610 family)